MTATRTVPMPKHFPPSLPNYVTDVLRPKFTRAELATVTREWHTYSEILFTRATNSRLISEARRILKLHGEQGDASVANRKWGYEYLCKVVSHLGFPAEGWTFVGHEDFMVSMATPEQTFEKNKSDLDKLTKNLTALGLRPLVSRDVTTFNYLEGVIELRTHAHVANGKPVAFVSISLEPARV